MTEIIQSDGNVAENVISNEKPHPLPEVYEHIRNHKNLAFAVSDKIEDPDTEQYARFLNDLSINGVSLGKIQGVAVEPPLSQYNDRHSTNRVVPTEEVEDWEAKLLNKGNVPSNIEGQTWWESADHIKCPITKTGEKLPAIVTSNDLSEKTPTFEEAKEMVYDLLDRIPGLDPSEQPEDSTNDEPSNNNSNDERPSVNDPTTINGVGQNTVEKFENNGFEIVPALDRENHVEPDQYEFEKANDDPSSVTSGLTTAEVKEQYEAAKDDLDELDCKAVEQRLIDGDLHDAVDMIENAL